MLYLISYNTKLCLCVRAERCRSGGCKATPLLLLLLLLRAAAEQQRRHSLICCSSSSTAQAPQVNPKP